MGINFLGSKKNTDQIPEEFKKIAEDFSEKGFITTSSDNLINWARTGSLHWMTFGLACLYEFKRIVRLKGYYVWESGWEGTPDPQDGKVKFGVQITPFEEIFQNYKKKNDSYVGK